MTLVSEIVPDPAMPAPVRVENVPGAWEVCSRCGATTPVPEQHGEWHDAIETRVANLISRAQGILDDLEAARAAVAALRAADDAHRTALKTLDQRVTALEEVP